MGRGAGGGSHKFNERSFSIVKRRAHDAEGEKPRIQVLHVPQVGESSHPQMGRPYVWYPERLNSNVSTTISSKPCSGQRGAWPQRSERRLLGHEELAAGLRIRFFKLGVTPGSHPLTESRYHVLRTKQYYKTQHISRTQSPKVKRTMLYKCTHPHRQYVGSGKNVT